MEIPTAPVALTGRLGVALMLLAVMLGTGINGLEKWVAPRQWPPAVALLVVPLLFGYLAARVHPRRAFALGFADADADADADDGLMFVAWVAVVGVEIMVIRNTPEWDESRILLDLPFAFVTLLPGMVLGFVAGGIGLALRRGNA